jgi:hypothetical protein
MAAHRVAGEVDPLRVGVQLGTELKRAGGVEVRLTGWAGFKAQYWTLPSMPLTNVRF